MKSDTEIKQQILAEQEAEKQAKLNAEIARRSNHAEETEAAHAEIRAAQDAVAAFRKSAPNVPGRDRRAVSRAQRRLGRVCLRRPDGRGARSPGARSPRAAAKSTARRPHLDERRSSARLVIQKPSQRFLDNTNEFRRKTIDAPVVIVAHGDLVKALTRFKKITGESLDELRRHREFLPKSRPSAEQEPCRSTTSKGGQGLRIPA